MEQFFNEQPIAERETRKPLIVPAVFAIISALLMLILWGINAGMILKQNNSLLYNEAVIEFLPMTTDILLFLFCLIQYKKGKTSLFSVGSMILVITYAIGLVSLLTISEFKINSNILFYTAFDTAILVLLLIGIISVFKKRLNKVIYIFTAALILLKEFFIFSIMKNTTESFQLTSILRFLAYALLAVTLLLIAVLWKKPAEEN